MEGDDATDWFADRLGNARADAERITRELADKGHLTSDQATMIVAAVDGAIGRGRELLAEALREPRRVLQSLRATMHAQAEAAPPSAASAAPGVHARLDALEERIAALEAAVRYAGTRRRGSEGD